MFSYAWEYMYLFCSSVLPDERHARSRRDCKIKPKVDPLKELGDGQ